MFGTCRSDNFPIRLREASASISQLAKTRTYLAGRELARLGQGLLRGAGSWILDPRSWILDPGIENRESRIPLRSAKPELRQGRPRATFCLAVGGWAPLNARRQGPWVVDTATPSGPEGSSGAALCVRRGSPDTFSSFSPFEPDCRLRVWWGVRIIRIPVHLRARDFAACHTRS